MNCLSNIILNNSKIEMLPHFKKEFNYINQLVFKVNYLNSKKKNYKQLYLDLSTSNNRNNNLLVAYIINISFLKANTMLHVSDIKGNVILFYTAGSVNLTGKQKRRRIITVLRLFKLLYKNASFLFGKPIALHLNNVNRNKFLIVKKLKQKFFIKLIREFNHTPYNGCRKPKIRRKKYKKKLL